jgi:hypothetical protein
VIRLTKLDPTTSASSTVLVSSEDISRVELDDHDPNHRTLITFKGSGAEIYVQESVEQVQEAIDASTTAS